MKKKFFVTSKDKEDWLSYTRNPKDIHSKEENNKKKYNENFFSKSLDLHGLSLDEDNKVTKNFITEFSEKGYRKLIIITGKGLRSKVDNDPYRSKKMNILKNSVPEYIKNNIELNNKVFKISKADLKDGGEGALYIFLKTIKE